MIQVFGAIDVATRGPGLVDVTSELQRWLSESRAREGLATAFIQHTSASLTVQENADPDVRADLVDALERLAPATARWRHATEGPDDMPAHVKTMLTSLSVSIPVRAGRALLGQWQALYLIEHRADPHRRTIALHFIGEAGGG